MKPGFANINLAGSRIFWAFLLGVAMLRLFSLSLYPLMDPTEARYGEVARLMAETGNWLVPQIDYDLPFMGKPPLSFWASALSINTFANSEFWLRLPHFLAAVATLLLTWQFVRALDFTRNAAAVSVGVVATSIGFLIAAGVVMTDMFLCLSMSLAMTGFWRGWRGERTQVYIMYAGLGIGLLVKGPVILVLAGLAILPWIGITEGPLNMWRQMFQRLYIFSGISLMLLIAAPWYFLMEQATPGFLDYFIVGEHFQRFVDSGWQGDLYGSAHARARGTIWVYWFVFALPWSPLLLLAGIESAVRTKKVVPRDPLTLFLVLWMCSPMLLFSLAGNILPAYIVPGLPAIGLLMMKCFRMELAYRGRLLLAVGPALFLILLCYIALYAGENHSDKSLLSNGVDSTDRLFYFHTRPHSAQYYSNGQARVTEDLPQQRRFYLVVTKDNKPDRTGDYCELRGTNDRRRLFYCQRDAS